MRYRRDVPIHLLDTNPEVAQQITGHIATHLLGATHPHDEPRGEPGKQLTLSYHENPDDPSLVSFIGEIDASPDAPYLRPGFDPDLDHPEIEFIPHEDPAAGQHYDQGTFLHWMTHGRHERRES